MATLYVMESGRGGGHLVPVEYASDQVSPEEVQRTYRALVEALSRVDPGAEERFAEVLGRKELPKEWEEFLPRGRYQLEALPLERGEVGVLVDVREGNLHLFAEYGGSLESVTVRFDRDAVRIALSPDLYEQVSGQRVEEPYVARFEAQALGLSREDLAYVAYLVEARGRLEEEARMGFLTEESLAYLEKRAEVEERAKAAWAPVLQALQDELNASFLKREEVEDRVMTLTGTIRDDRGDVEGYYLLELREDGTVKRVEVSPAEMGEVASGEWYGNTYQFQGRTVAQDLQYSSREEEVAEKLNPPLKEDLEAKAQQARLGGLTPSEPLRDQEPEL